MLEARDTSGAVAHALAIAGLRTCNTALLRPARHRPAARIQDMQEQDMQEAQDTCTRAHGPHDGQGVVACSQRTRVESDTRGSGAAVRVR